MYMRVSCSYSSQADEAVLLTIVTLVVKNGVLNVMVILILGLWVRLRLGLEAIGLLQHTKQI